ncbi:MAG TPA: lipoprotein signal peptide [Raoultella sp.]|nr:lipoprotein signal peptide [Raoultella sp.]
MFRRGFLLLPALLICIQVHAAPGFRQLALADPQGKSLDVAVWYPTSAEGKTENVGANPAFEGVAVIRNAPARHGAHPLLVISHGYNGNWRNLSWIAVAMAAQGYIVAAPDHPGTTTFNQDPRDAKRLWRRPQDLSQVIDFTLRSSALVGEVDAGRIAALGHSLGGWTVMSLAGARFDSARMLSDCLHHAQRGDCRLTQKLGIDGARSQDARFADLRDARIKAVVSLDLGFAPGFTPQSLRALGIPVLILAAQADKLADLDAEQESGYLAANLDPQRRQYEVVEGATHFSFMQLCKPGAEALIEEETPGDGIVCRDGSGGDRAAIHQALIPKIGRFLNSALDYRPPADETK